MAVPGASDARSFLFQAFFGGQEDARLNGWKRIDFRIDLPPQLLPQLNQIPDRLA